MTNHPHRSKQQQAKHTPGPWNCDGVQVRDTAGTILATMYRTSWVSDGLSEREIKANACLIAAAPETAAERDRLKALNAELLATLKRALQNGETDGPASAMAVLNTAGRAAIAKAEGR